MKIKELFHVIFQPVPPDQDESNSWVRYSMQNKKPDKIVHVSITEADTFDDAKRIAKAKGGRLPNIDDYMKAWEGYTPSRREWMRRSLHPWWVEFLAPWIVLGPALLFIILILLFVW